jgi:hypothetical protein
MARKLRIAVSVFFGVLTIVLCVLWVRSYSKQDTLNTRWYFIASFRGQLFADTGFLGERFDGRDTHTLYTMTPDPVDQRYTWQPIAPVKRIPYWVLVAIAGSIAAIPWRPAFRFSLRTLLIATTLVAVVLGLGMWAAS